MSPASPMRQEVELIRRRLRRNLSWQAAFVGERGNGKSTLMLQMARAIDPDFTIRRVTWNTADTIRIASQVPKFSVIVQDEGAPSKRRSMSRDNVGMVDFFATFREFNVCVFVARPELQEFDPAIVRTMNRIYNVLEVGRVRAETVRKSQFYSGWRLNTVWDARFPQYSHMLTPEDYETYRQAKDSKLRMHGRSLPGQMGDAMEKAKDALRDTVNSRVKQFIPGIRWFP